MDITTPRALCEADAVREQDNGVQFTEQEPGEADAEKEREIRVTKGVLTPCGTRGWEGLDVKASRIPGAGRGLFVSAGFKKGDTLCEYVSVDSPQLPTKAAIKLQVRCLGRIPNY